MRAAVVFESMFGNTRWVAEAVAAGLRSADPSAEVALVPVAGASPDVAVGADLVVVGGPTHRLGMASRRSRAVGLRIGAREEREGGTVLEPRAAGPGVREWLERAVPALPGQHAAAFDTRLGYPLAGGASHSIARRLRRLGFELDARPMGFVVQDVTGPLAGDQLDAARRWGTSLAVRRPALVE